jgi:hypothetical protein
VIAELKQTGELREVCRCRPSLYMNNIIEQDHPNVLEVFHQPEWQLVVFRAGGCSQELCPGK